MNEQEKTTLRNLKNANGKRLLEKTRLEYSKEIIAVIQTNPQILPELLEYLDLTEEEFYSYISGDTQGNIALYDTALTQGINLNKVKTKPENKKDKSH